MTEAVDGILAARADAPRARTGYWMRRLRRHLGIAVVSTLIALLVFRVATEKDSWTFRASMATAYASIALMGWALAIGPWRVWRGRTPATSLDLRRDLGIWSALLAVAHVATGLQVHMRGDMLNYFLYRARDGAHAIPIRMDPFGIVNWTGLAATVLLVLLVLISNDASLRALGATRWKRFQRATYLAAALTALHGLAFQLMDHRGKPYILLFGGIVAVVLALQLRGRNLVRSRSRDSRR